MKIGLIGLGKMGLNLGLNFQDHHHEIIGFDVLKEVREEAKKLGINTVDDVDKLLAKLPTRKVLWVMVPSGHATESTIEILIEKLSKNDILIEAGNSNYKDSIRRCEIASKKGIHYLDVGTSGGISGARNGACLMIGGSEEGYAYLESVFCDVALENGYLYAGKSGSGHFLKMVHNGVEYGMMQAIGEGFQLVEESNFDFDLERVASIWNHGSVIRGWLMELAQSQFVQSPKLSNYKGIVAASGEAKWTVETALEMEVAVPVIALSLMMRNRSQEEDSFSAKVVAALRNGFGGHSFVEKNHKGE
ncbi:MAG: phosphogluconate dehydrogenase (NAD(+)-dependent, decarboxylating) [Breznakia sp.]